MTFRLATLFYAFALVAASLGVLGTWGILLVIVVYFWWLSTNEERPRDLSPIQLCLALIAICLLISTLFVSPNADRARRLAKRSASMSKLKQISMSLLNYESTHGCFPPAVIRDDNGKALYSWRVELLPYLGESQFYEQLRLDEPWNSQHNQKVLSNCKLDLFSSPRTHRANPETDVTNYVAVVGDETAWPDSGRVSINSVLDGCSNTISIIEVGGLDFHWAEPRDVTLDQAIDLMTGNGKNHFEFERTNNLYFYSETYALDDRIVGYIDGHIGILSPLANHDDARRLLTIADGEEVNGDPQFREDIRPFQPIRTITRWDRIIGFAALVVIILLPAIPTVRRKVLPTQSKPPSPPA